MYFPNVLACNEKAIYFIGMPQNIAYVPLACHGMWYIFHWHTNQCGIYCIGMPRVHIPSVCTHIYAVGAHSYLYTCSWPGGMHQHSCVPCPQAQNGSARLRKTTQDRHRGHREIARLRSHVSASCRRTTWQRTRRVDMLRQTGATLPRNPVVGQLLSHVPV